MATVTMTYGDYSFTPVPLINMDKQYTKTGDQTNIGTVWKVTLNGTLTPLPDGVGGITNVVNLQRALREAFAQEGLAFEVICGEDTLIYAYPRILSLSFPESPNNWVLTSPYTIELEYDDELSVTGEVLTSGEDNTLMPLYLSSASENWSVEFVDDRAKYTLELEDGPDTNPYALRLTHTVNAVGKRRYVSGIVEAEGWEQARNWVIDRLGYDSNKVSISGVFNLDPDIFAAYNHIRTNTTDELSGEFAVTETWLVVNPSGSGISGRALEDFDISVKSGVDNNATMISIQGQIAGLETRDYGTGVGDFAIDETKYEAALDYWSVIRDRLYYRASEIGSSIATRPVHITPLNSTISHNPPQGTINYTYEFDDRPCNYITGALSEQVEISDSYPTDIFARITVPGRNAGPILQSIDTVTENTRQVSIQAVMAVPSGCDSIVAAVGLSPRTQVNELLCELQTDLTDNYGQVFKTVDNETWNPKTGSYSRNIQWTYTNCSGEVDTSVC
jgi:hypothetical protein